MQVKHQEKAETRIQEENVKPPRPRGFKAPPTEGPPQTHSLMVPDENFEKKEHILKTGEFARIYKKGIFRKAGPIVIYRLPNGLKHSRIGFSISSSRVPLATRRNRIRRLLREAFRKNKKGIKPGFDIIAVLKKEPPRTISYGQMEEIFLKLAREADLLC